MTAWFALGLLVAALAQQRGAAQPPPADLDRFVRRALTTFQVPGAALAIVKDGRTVLAAGYGHRRLGDSATVDGNTLFAIGSNSKAFTSAGLAILVDEGKVAWDDPITRHLPGFQMYDPYVTREITVRDALTHRSGLGNGLGDLLHWPGTDFSRTEIVERIRYLKPRSGFRSRYAYDNLMYLVAGQVIEAAAGMPWEQFMATRIFRPAGMARAQATAEAVWRDTNTAWPHGSIDGAVQSLTRRKLDNIAAAGGISASAADMARWLTVLLGQGTVPDGGPVVYSAARAREMWRAQTPMPFGEPPPELASFRTNFAAYALGWNLREFRGLLLVTHAGGVPGFISQLSLVPKLGLGIAILTNQEQGAFVAAVGDYLLEWGAGIPPNDWVAFFEKRIRTNPASAAASAPPVDNRGQPSLPLADYARQYRDTWRGEVTVELAGAQLVLRFSRTEALVADLVHWSHDTFVARWRDRSLNADAFVSFSISPAGEVDRMTMKPISDEVDSSFDFEDLDLRPAAQTTKGR